MKYDLVVLGTGPGGYTLALKAAQLGLKVACIEAAKEVGGTCLNVGCIPSKTMLYYTELYSLAQTASHILSDTEFNFSALQEEKTKVVTTIRHSLELLFKKAKVDIIQGFGTLVDAHGVQVENNTIEGANIVLATGSIPIELPFLPFDEEVVLSSTGVLDLHTVPETLAVIGGGVIGVELASVYARAGTEVTLIEMLPVLCSGIDADCSKGLQHSLQSLGIECILSTKVKSAKRLQTSVRLELENTKTIEVEKVLVSIGRRPASKNLGLEKLGITLQPSGHIVVDGNFKTGSASVYAIGDLIEGPMLAHRASYEGVALAEYFAGKRSQCDYITVPNVIYTEPEIASIGFTEDELKKLERPYNKGLAFLRGNPRAHASGMHEGFVKVIAEQNTNKLLGLHMFCPHASEMICLAMLALSKKCTVDDVADLPFAHPTLSEAIKEACLQILKKAIH